MVLAAVLTDASRDCQDGVVPVRYRTDGRLFNPRRLQAVTKVKETAVRDLSLMMTVP